ncbi:MAG: right-handed parallel beta-helix repeat-containing protein [Lentisphaeria bacterium]|nr:right-handed parallel beta-helix repeat-containing protein [Lentisphaeria bacterium]
MNIREFGAVGDGRQDDTQAIQDAVQRGEGLLRFPLGTYRIIRPIAIDLDIWGRLALSGERGLAKIVMAGPGPAFLIRGSHEGTASPESITPEVLDVQRFPTIDGIEIQGAHPEADGIRLEGLWQPHLTSVYVHDCRHGIHVTGRNRNLLISHCHIHNNSGAGVFYDRLNLHQSNIVGSHISYNKRGGIRVVESEIRNFQITGNDIEYNFDPEASESADIWIDTLSSSIREGTISSNTIQALPSPGGVNVLFRGRGGTVRHKAGLWTISGNLITNQMNNIRLEHTRGVTITGNAFGSAREHALVLEHCDSIVAGSNSFDHNEDYRVPMGGGAFLRDCTGCNISGSLFTLGQAAPPFSRAVVELHGCAEVNMTGCQILDPAPAGLLLADSRNCLVSGCMILDRREPPKMTDAVLVEGGSGHVFSGNNVSILQCPVP